MIILKVFNISNPSYAVYLNQIFSKLYWFIIYDNKYLSVPVLINEILESPNWEILLYINLGLFSLISDETFKLYRLTIPPFPLFSAIKNTDSFVFKFIDASRISKFL